MTNFFKEYVKALLPATVTSMKKESMVENNGQTGHNWTNIPPKRLLLTPLSRRRLL